LTAMPEAELYGM